MPKNKHSQATLIETISEDNLEKNTKDHGPEKSDKPSTDPKKPSKRLIFSLITIALFLCIITGTFLLIFSKKPETKDETEHQLTEVESTPFYFYDNLTGEVISHSGIQYNERGEKIIEADGSTRKLSVKEAEQMAKNANEQPIYCIQIPNGLDGARPQVGLHRASIVFEAIAEVGITRFAAIFKNPVGAQAIGPIRSLRLYHLEWDTPFDCTVVHAGGADDALAAVRNYRHISESVNYMWRNYGQWSGGAYLGYTAPNNLFTSGPLLATFLENTARGSFSKPKSFARLTKDESDAQKKEIEESQVKKDEDQTNTQNEVQDKSQDTKKENPKKLVSNIHIHFNRQQGFNVNYAYSKNTNTYFRSYANGETHLSYTCENVPAKPSPKRDCNQPYQINPDVVIVMRVKERTSPLDGYHEDITTTGSGKVHIFQNGTVFEGTWHKANRESQISFKTTTGEEIKLKPGRTWISAIPDSYGKLSYE